VLPSEPCSDVSPLCGSRYIESGKSVTGIGLISSYMAEGGVPSDDLPCSDVIEGLDSLPPSLRVNRTGYLPV
jgi:hypothetical protein